MSIHRTLFSQVFRSRAIQFASLVIVTSLLAPDSVALQKDHDARLIGKFGCTNCHAASDAVLARTGSLQAPNLVGAIERVSPEYMRRFLRRPHLTKEGTSMPDILGGFEKDKRNTTAHRIIGFLASLGEPTIVEPTGADLMELENGRQLFHTVGCVACHAPLESADDLEAYVWETMLDEEDSKSARDQRAEVEAARAALAADGGISIPLGKLANKTHVSALTAFLINPTHARPSGRMPFLGLNETEARAISLYLLQDQALGAKGGLKSVQGLGYDYFEANVPSTGADFDSLEVARSGSVADFSKLPDHRSDNFAFRFRGTFTTQSEGMHRFATTSDDGSMLYVDGETVVDNGGNHAPKRVEGEIWLEAGQHNLEVTMFENGGGEMLEVKWQPPGEEERPLETEVLSHFGLAWTPPGMWASTEDNWRIAKGRELFQDLGCVNCHAVPTLDVTIQVPALADLTAGQGCMAETVPPSLPDYKLSADERAALARALSSLETLTEPRSARDELEVMLEDFACTSCHRRGVNDAPHPNRREHFISLGDFDLGNEERFPPALDHVGAKLRPDWMHSVIGRGESIRPYLATRMPHFGDAVADKLTELFQATDGTPEGRQEPVFTQQMAEAGQELVGTRGLSCIQCHHFAGYPSLGIPAVDLADVHARIQPGWFRQLLLDPKSVGMNSRMPEFLIEGQSPISHIFDGDPGQQVDAIRTYLSLKNSMPLPEGLIATDGEYELVPKDGTVVCSVFMKGVSARAVLIGMPQGVHAAFDVENSRLVRAWSGRFFNAVGTWRGRAGVKEVPGGEDSVNFPRGPVFTTLEEAGASWPNDSGREAGMQPLGRRIDDDGHPTFQYQIGVLTIEERVDAVTDELPAGKKAALIRSFHLSAPTPVDDLYLRAIEGKEIVALDAGHFRVDKRIDIRLDPKLGAFVREGTDASELRIPVVMHPADPTSDKPSSTPHLTRTIEVELSW